MITAGLPVARGLRGILQFAAHAAACSLHGGFRPPQAHVELARATFGIIISIVHPATGIQRQRLTAPGMQTLQGFALIEIEPQGRLGRRDGKHLETHLGDHPERAPRPRHETRQVIPGHVLHHLTTKAQQFALAIDDLDAQHIVTHRTHTGPRRPRQPGSHHAADSATHAEARRLERQTLAVLRQECLQLRQGRAGAHRHHQLAGLVIHDARKRTQIQPLGLAERRRGPTRKVLGATATNAQSAAKLRAIAHNFNDLGKRC